MNIFNHSSVIKKHEKRANLKDDLYEENDLIDVKITTNKLNNKETKNSKETTNQTNYGGI